MYQEWIKWQEDIVYQELKEKVLREHIEHMIDLMKPWYW